MFELLGSDRFKMSTHFTMFAPIIQPKIKFLGEIQRFWRRGTAVPLGKSPAEAQNAALLREYVAVSVRTGR
jgi:hypothetical protein